jgi:tetratricopeptide (TPR) repeat protein
MNALGYMFVEQGIKLDEAQELIERALEIDSLNGYYIDSLGWLFFKKGDYLRAKELLLKAGMCAKDAVIYDHLGDVYQQLGDGEKAHEMWLKALELDPGNEDITEKINLYIREKTPK